MPINERLDSHKAVETAFGKLIPEKEAYTYAMRHIAGFSANIFQLMRILNPSWEERTYAICEMANTMNMGAANSSAAAKQYLENFYDEFNIPELCNRTSWLGGIFGDSGDEWENMAGRVIQFTENRVEKELDTCPWDIVGSEMCNMTTSMFTANFDIAASPENGMEPTNKVALNMCEARGCGNPHCRVVAERRDAFDLPKQDWLDHMQQPTQPVHDTPIERRVKEGQVLRNGSYVQAFGEERSLEWSYGWVCWSGWLWSVCFPLGAIEDMADDDDEFERLLRIVFATAGKNMFLEPVAKGAIRDWLGVPHELGDKDPRIMGAYIKNILDTQLVPCELTAFDEDGCEIVVDSETFSARFPMSPCDEIVWGHEAMWNGAVKTLVDPEWSVWFEGVDDDEMTIVVGRKVDPRM